MVTTLPSIRTCARSVNLPLPGHAFSHVSLSAFQSNSTQHQKETPGCSGLE
jgi:hypothetical protein